MDENAKRIVHDLLVDLMEEHDTLFFEANDLDSRGPNDMGNRMIEAITLTAPSENQGFLDRLKSLLGN